MRRKRLPDVVQRFALFSTALLAIGLTTGISSGIPAAAAPTSTLAAVRYETCSGRPAPTEAHFIRRPSRNLKPTPMMSMTRSSCACTRLHSVLARTKTPLRPELPLVDGLADRFSIPFRYASPAELDLMARLAGLRLRERTRNWRGDAFTAESAHHVSVYERAGSPGA